MKLTVAHCNINGYLILTGEANVNCPYICLIQQVKVQVGLRVPTPSPVDIAQSYAGY